MADVLAEQQAERMQKFLRRWVPYGHHEAAFGDLLEIAKAHADHGVDMMAETAANRKQDLENLVIVYEATVYCMLPFFKQSKMADMMITQVSACADAHMQTMGEPAMYAEQVPPYEPWKAGPRKANHGG
jgi:hypothetical protein